MISYNFIVEKFTKYSEPVLSHSILMTTVSVDGILMLDEETYVSYPRTNY